MGKQGLENYHQPHVEVGGVLVDEAHKQGGKHLGHEVKFVGQVDIARRLGGSMQDLVGLVQKVDDFALLLVPLVVTQV